MADRTRPPEAGEIGYLNTDLDLRAAKDLAPLAAALEALGVHPLFPPSNEGAESCVTLETDDYHREPETTMTAMLAAIESLDGEAGAAWEACTLREFNIGYDCGDRPWAFNTGLSNRTLRRLAAAGATLRITLYPQRTPAGGGMAERRPAEGSPDGDADL